MGPRILIRGNEPAYEGDDSALKGFNGAADFNPRKLVTSKEIYDALCSFNGAADFNPRKSWLTAL